MNAMTNQEPGIRDQYDPKKILVVRLSAVGDVVRTVPAVQAIRNRFPDSTIHWLVEDRCAEMIHGLNCIDATVQVPRRRWKKIGALGKLRGFLQFTRELRQAHYDLYIDIHGILKSGLYGAMARIPRRVGYPRGIAKEWNTLFSTEIIPAKPRRMSRYERNFLMARYFDPEAREMRPALPLDEHDRNFAREFLRKQGLGSGGFAFLYPGTSPRGRYKRWLPERYGQLVDQLAALDIPCLVGWGPGEEPIVESLRATASAQPVIPPLTTLKELAALIESARVFIGGDTGPMHMASLLGTPVVTIFGPSDPVINEPARFTPFRIVRANADCSPCRKKNCDHLTCLTEITPDQVMSATTDLLHETGRNQNPTVTS